VAAVRVRACHGRSLTPRERACTWRVRSRLKRSNSWRRKPRKRPSGSYLENSRGAGAPVGVRIPPPLRARQKTAR